MHVKAEYEITRGDTHGLSDVSEFLGMLSRLRSSLELGTFFDQQHEITIARAPGRLDVMGGIADYSGSLVLELPIAEATFVALQKQDARELRIVSLVENEGRVLSFDMPLSDFERDGEPVEYDEARAYFKSDRTRQWAAYVAGVFLVLMRQLGVRFDRGARILISSSVPEGKGVSSSAALEVATMTAVAAAFRVAINPREIALLCQRVENLVVGAPCGVMDQMTSACGEADQLLALVCQPAELLGTIQLPEDLAVWGLDSGVRHSVAGGDYGSVRAGTFMGYRIIAELAGFNVERASDRIVIKDPRWGGYLANLSPFEFEEHFAPKLPESMSGDEFLSRYEGTVDAVTSVVPERVYPVRAPTAHAVNESFRVQKFAELLRRQHDKPNDEDKVTMGRLMYESHASYSACGLGSTGTDLLVELVKSAGVDQGLFGAKITGGGSGGTVAVLGNRNAEPALENVAQSYATRTGHQPYVFRGSSPGSAAFGHLVVQQI
ncbi:MAG TPA: galactokinase family protein [Pyrinomonadaceae bacterium]|nr:galactokinase family protein [Pyrinomonadaceae bacterium]